MVASTEVIFEGSMAFVPESRAMVFMGADGGERKIFNTLGGKPSMPRNSREPVNSGVINWGDGNSMPVEILKEIRADSSIEQIIRWKANIAVRRGLVAMQVTDHDDQGNEVLKYIKDAEIQEFYSNKRFKRWHLESFLDLYSFQNAGSELILSKDRSKILQLVHQEVMYSRFEERQADGSIKNVVLSGDFPYITATNVAKVPLIDPYSYNNIADVRNGKDFKYWYPTNFPSIGDNDLHQTPSWWGFVKSGWKDVRKMIPKAKVAMMKNRMLVLYMIEIPSTYWQTQNSNWSSLSKEEKMAIKKAKLDEMNEFLTDMENHGKGIITEFPVDDQGKAFHGWKITPIGDKSKEGMYLDDFQESTALMFYAFGVDPTLAGFASKEMGSRSGGSDKREALLIYEETIQPERDLALEAALFVAEYNGWMDKYPGFKLCHTDKVLTTLDTGGGTKKVVG